MTSTFHWRHAWPWRLAALVLGLGAGALDLIGHAVQGPLLVLMAAAFAIALPRRTSAWSVGLATWAGLPIAHVVAIPWGGEAPSWGMLIALLPTLGAALAGAFVGKRIDRTAGAIPLGPLGTATAVWYWRPADSGLLLLSVLAVCAAAGLVPVYGALYARGQPVAWWVATWWQIASFVGWVALLPLVVRYGRRLPASERPISPAQLLVHLGVVLAGAMVHALAIVILTRMLLVLLGAASFARAVLWAFTAYLPVDALTYALVLTIARASDRDRLSRQAREHAAALGAQLDRARLAALEAQLRPHFLFNALNVAVVLVTRGSSAQAAEVLTGLADLLRYAMEGSSDLVPLEAELELIRKYLGIEQVRLGDRLQWRVEVSPDVGGVLVPRLLLQPLVENAIRHGVGKQLRGGTVSVLVHAERDDLRLTVEDDGPGLAGSHGEGIGIANTRARLEMLYRGRASLTLRASTGGGCIAEVSLPRTVSEARIA